MSYFLCNFRNQGKEIGEEDKPVCPGNEEPTKPSEEDKPVDPLTILEKRSRESEIILEDKPVCPGNEEPTKPSEEDKPVFPGDDETTMVSEDLPRTKNQLRVVSLHMKSLFLSFTLAVIIIVGVKVAFPDVDLQIIGGMSMIGFFTSIGVSLLVQQL